MNTDLRLWFDGLDFVIARDQADADDVWLENHTDQDRAEHVAEQAPIVKPWTVYDKPTLSIEEHDPPETRTPAEWIAADGRGYLCAIDPECIG
jgi:hypothetical protein